MNQASLDELYDSGLIHSVQGLALISRQVVETYLSGVNHSLRTGFGMEFSQYRPYEPGDDLRMLDWKLAARREKLYVRQSEIESNTSILFLVDASASMQHHTDKLSKIDAARILVSTLAYIANRQGDAIGLLAVNDHKENGIIPARKRQQYQQLLYQLIAIQCKGRWPSRITIPGSIREKKLIIAMSDFYQKDNQLINSLLNINNSSIDIVCIHLTSGMDWEPEQAAGATFEDLETGRKVSVGRRFNPAEYATRWKDYIEGVRHQFLENDIRYFGIRTDKSIPSQIKLMLDQRPGN